MFYVHPQIEDEGTRNAFRDLMDETWALGRRVSGLEDFSETLVLCLALTIIVRLRI
jgi:hypothetical protein